MRLRLARRLPSRAAAIRLLVGTVLLWVVVGHLFLFLAGSDSSTPPASVVQQHRAPRSVPTVAARRTATTTTLPLAPVASSATAAAAGHRPTPASQPAVTTTTASSLTTATLVRRSPIAVLWQLARALPWVRPVVAPLPAAAAAAGGAADSSADCVELWRSQSRFHRVSAPCRSRSDLQSATDAAAANASLVAQCARPLVAWDAPLAGGLTAGLASEAVSFLVPLARSTDIVLASMFRADSSFVAGLDPAERGVLKKLRALKTAGLLPRPHIFVSQWAPGTLWLTKKNEYGPPADAYIISRAMYEATKLPMDWEPNFDKIDEFWVPSEWNRRIFIDQYKVKPEKVVVVEEGLNTREPFNPALFHRTTSRQRVYPEDVQDAFIFLSIFKWESRKAYRELISAFTQEFEPDENVQLFLRTSPDRDLESIVKEVAGHADPRIRLLARQEDHRYQQMFMGADAFVLATHGEGWGRPLMEAMAMEIPVIAANWSGPTQFVTADTGYLLPVKKLEAADGLPGATWGAEWAHISVTDLRRLLRRVVAQPEEARAIARAGREHIVKHYDQDVVVKQVERQLQRACYRQAQGHFPRMEKKPSSNDGGNNAYQPRQAKHGNSDWVWKWGGGQR